MSTGKLLARSTLAIPSPISPIDTIPIEGFGMLEAEDDDMAGGSSGDAMLIRPGPSKIWCRWLR